MQRRNFIKSALCLGCLGTFTAGCVNLFDKTKAQNKFLYKSKQDLPKKIRLEACSLCQLNCAACSVRMLEKDAPKDWLGYLKFKDFKNFVDDNYFEEIELSNHGEIFLNPELDEIIKYAHKKKIRLSAGSGVNLNTVSEATLENLVKYKFRYIKVSIDGATNETYKIYRRGGDFNTVINNIKKINYYKQKYNSEYPRLIWQFILFGHNEHEIELAKQKAQELNMQIKFRKNWMLEYSPVKNKKLVEKQTGLRILETEEELIKDAIETENLFSCKLLFVTPQIDYNGDVLGCCRVFTGNFGVNVFKQGFFNALNSPNILYAKNMLSDLSFPIKKEFPCSDCPKCQFFRERQSVSFLK